VSLITEFIKMFDCDTVRIAKYDKMFLIIGYNQNTKDDPGQIYRNGEPWDYDYVQEKVIASGDNEKELIVSAKKYKRLCGLTWKKDFNEIVQILKEGSDAG